MKDLFSSHSVDYSRYRPTYPAELFNFLQRLCESHERAWDCGTGNGQVAGELASIFEQVCATDISIKQLSQAVQKPNIKYTRQRAESTSFPDDHFNLVTIGQAAHWFDLDAFYSEVKRVLKKDAVIAIFGYALFRSNTETNEVIDHFYNKIVGPYWQPERRYLEENYQTIPFRFKEIPIPQFHLRQQWSFERLIGYLNTWSAVKSYEQENNENPVELIRNELYRSFGDIESVDFTIIGRIGRNNV
ncbi:class I SAM-dependent methyltransferase [Salinimicrobium xinjiangense]|uniref:class I SAM-dependent methyltransferase n=1 Tax=Salinimicrobium xinjiangense TaxID=438596 RepID=UPI00041C1AA6|nr:class I SAM-dependent methyltransferase [Salinimicrobium xinjiangense]